MHCEGLQGEEVRRKRNRIQDRVALHADDWQKCPGKMWIDEPDLYTSVAELVLIAEEIAQYARPV